MRIIAEKDSSARWAAWWKDSPDETFGSANILGAVGKLLSRSDYDILIDNFVRDKIVTRDDHVEIVVLRTGIKAAGTDDDFQKAFAEYSQILARSHLLMLEARGLVARSQQLRANFHELFLNRRRADCRPRSRPSLEIGVFGRCPR